MKPRILVAKALPMGISIARESGIPAVAGIKNAAIILNGKEIAMDGMDGGVYCSRV